MKIIPAFIALLHVYLNSEQPNFGTKREASITLPSAYQDMYKVEKVITTYGIFMKGNFADTGI